MPNQQRLEGPSLEALLDEVREAHGSEVKIVEANKIRKGGVGGFFARELFEVVIEADDEADASAKAPTGRRPSAHRSANPAPARTLMELVDQVDDGPIPESTPAGLAAVLERVAAERSRGTAPPPEPSATVSTDGEEFADLLNRIAADARRTRPRPHTAAGSGMADDRNDDVFQPFADSAARLSSTNSTVARPATSTSPTPGPLPTGSADATTYASRPTSTSAQPTTTTISPTPEAVTEATAPARSPQPVRGLRAPARPASSHRPLDPRAMARLGLPTDWASDLPTHDTLTILLDLARRFPAAAPLPDLGGSVIALAGDHVGLTTTIDWVCEELDLPADQIIVASQSETSSIPHAAHLTEAGDAALRRRSWQRREHPVVVVLDDHVSRRGTAWARTMLDALEPAAIWGVVDAQRKTEDVVEWCDRIGGLDAVALYGTDDTASPASIVAAGLPVSLLDGYEASPARWAALLQDRLEAA